MAVLSFAQANGFPNPKMVAGLNSTTVSSCMFYIFTLWLFNSLPWKDPPFFIGKPSINGPFSMAMLNNQRVAKDRR